MTEQASRPARLFLALWPDADVVSSLVEARRGWRWAPSAQLVGPQRLHLTLHFLGDVARDRVEALQAGLKVGFDPFSLELGRPEIWRGGIAVLRPMGVPSALTGLRARLSEALARQGLPVEAGAFKAHVTMARQAQGSEAPGVPPRLRWMVTRYVLAESVSGPPARYDVLHDWSVA